VNSHIPLLDDDYQESDLGNVLVRDWYLYVIAPIPRLEFNSKNAKVDVDEG